MFTGLLQPSYDHPLARDFWSIAQEHQPAGLSFHDLLHPLTTERIALNLAERYQKLGAPINPLVVSIGSLGHDLEYDVTPPKGESKEKRSAAITGEILRGLGAPKEFINQTKTVIRGTEAGMKCEGNEAVTVRRADLDNLTYSPEEFLRFTSAYAYEFTQLGQTLPTWQKWASFAKSKLLELTQGDDLVLRDANGVVIEEAVFPEMIHRNISLLDGTFEVVKGVGQKAVNNFFDLLPWNIGTE